MKSCHYSHLSGSKVDVDVTVTIASCVRASQQTFASLFFLFSSLLTLVHTPMRSHRFSHSQLAESSQHSWAPSMTSSLSLSFDLTPHLSQLSWAIFITTKKRLKSLSWQDVCQASQSGSLRPSRRRTCERRVFELLRMFCAAAAAAAAASLHLMKRPIFCVLPQLRCTVTIKEQWGLCVCVCVCVRFSLMRHWQGQRVTKSARYSLERTVPVT